MTRCVISLTRYDAVRYKVIEDAIKEIKMSNAAKKLPRVVREKIELAEQRRQEVVGRLDAWAEATLPQNIVRPLKEADAVSVDTIKAAASAAGEELLGYLRNRLTVLRGGKVDVNGQPADREPNPPAKSDEALKPSVKPAQKKTRTRTVAKKTPAKKTTAARKTAVKGQGRTAAGPKKAATTKAKTPTAKRTSKKTSAPK